MGLLSFLKRDRVDDAAAVPAKASRAAKPPAAGPDDIQRARTRARQRLIGAVVLLAIGVIAFPIVFETQPRPIPVDLPIEIPRRDAAPPLPAPKPRSTAPRADAAAPQSAAPVIEERAADAGREIEAPASAPTAPGSKPAEQPRAVAEPNRLPATAAPAEPAREQNKPAAPAESARAQALLEDKPSPPKAGDVGRFIVQVGAFSEAAAARETRSKVEKLGLRTYTQVVETDAGRRIRVRVGPFASRDEADKAAGRIKSAGLPSAVLGL